jgi:hypothetical protein
LVLEGNGVKFGVSPRVYYILIIYILISEMENDECVMSYIGSMIVFSAAFILNGSYRLLGKEKKMVR